VVLADAGYGVDGKFREGITSLGLRYAVGVQSSITVWEPGKEPLPPKPYSGTGLPRSCFAATPTAVWFRPGDWHNRFRRTRGKVLCGVKAPVWLCVRDLRR